MDERNQVPRARVWELETRISQSTPLFIESGAVVAFTLQAADQGDTTNAHQTLAEAGLAVAELVGREVELHHLAFSYFNHGLLQAHKSLYWTVIPSATRAAR